MGRWRCPVCGRELARPNQWHSCLRSSVEKHFEGSTPILRKTYEELIRRLEAFGRVNVDPVKTSIILGSRAHFAVVYPDRDSWSWNSSRITRSKAKGSTALRP